MPETAADAGAAFLNGLFARLDIDIQAKLSEDRDETLVFALEGETGALERAPELRASIALLTSQALSRSGGRRLRCALDVDGRLAEREALLTQAAADVARAVQKNGRKAVFDGLSAAERRVVHTALADSAEVKTQSEGAGNHRLLCVQRTGAAADGSAAADSKG